MEEYTVYWYHLEQHSNPHSDGYIGITNNISRRHLEHMRKAGNSCTHFYNAIDKYGKEAIIKDILHVCTKDEALDWELYYRPDTNIGWNTAIGGEDTLKSVQCKEVKLYHKDDPTKIHTFTSSEEASKALGITAGRIRQAVYRGKSVYGYDGWAVLFDDDYDTSLTISISESISNQLTGVKRNKDSHFKGMTDRWNDEQKALIGSYHKGKTISEEHKQAISDKLRANSPCCKTIVLYHKDDVDKEYTFHSIAEASRQLGLPLSRLKSKAQRPLNRFGKDGWAIKSLGSE